MDTNAVFSLGLSGLQLKGGNLGPKGQQAYKRKKRLVHFSSYMETIKTNRRNEKRIFCLRVCVVQPARKKSLSHHFPGDIAVKIRRRSKRRVFDLIYED